MRKQLVSADSQILSEKGTVILGEFLKDGDGVYIVEEPKDCGCYVVRTSLRHGDYEEINHVLFPGHHSTALENLNKFRDRLNKKEGIDKMQFLKLDKDKIFTPENFGIINAYWYHNYGA